MEIKYKPKKGEAVEVEVEEEKVERNIHKYTRIELFKKKTNKQTDRKKGRIEKWL